jgi:hypothetical protein
MTQLPVKKIYIDSRYATADSPSTSNFKFQLSRNIHMPQNTVFYLEDVCIPHSWYSVEKGINDTFYFAFNTSAWATYQIVLPSTNYTGQSLATALQTALDTAVGMYSSGVSYFAVSYNININSITIALNRSGTLFEIPSDNDIIANFAQYGYSGNTPFSCNELIGNTGSIANVYTSTNPYVSGMLNLNPFRNIYISSPNLGSFTTLGARGESNIIKKVPVTSDFGFLVIDSFTSSHDFLDCSRLTLGTIEFNLRDVKGNFIPLHGGHVSFSIVLSSRNDE